MTPSDTTRILEKLDTLIDTTARMDERLSNGDRTLKDHEDRIRAIEEAQRGDTATRGMFAWADVARVIVAAAALLPIWVSLRGG